MIYTYKKAALGGTFDHFHLGHMNLIKTAAKIAEKLVIGICTKPLYQHKEWPELIQSYEQRLDAVRTFTQQFKSQSDITLIPLTDLYGSTLEDEEIDVLVVTIHTRGGGKKINEERQKLKLSILPLVTAQLVRDTSGEYISSTRIRAGQINQIGEVYRSIFLSDQVVDRQTKLWLKIPKGPVFTDPSAIHQLIKGLNNCIALIGDVTTQTFTSHNIPYNFAVIDGKSQRKEFPDIFQSLDKKSFISVSNPAGVITAEAADAIYKVINRSSGLIRVTGEEDLLAVPMALALPLGSYIFYGQVSKGIVAMQVTQELKDQIFGLLRRTISVIDN